MESSNNNTAHRNGSFSSSFGFIISCVGSAVGLGNIWMFPYRLGQYGGAAFLIPYLLFVFLFGWVGLSAEFGIGRLARTGTLGSYRYCFSARREKAGKFGEALGWIPLLGSLGIAIGYAIILGWVLRLAGVPLPESCFPWMLPPILRRQREISAVFHGIQLWLSWCVQSHLPVFPKELKK